MKVRHSCGHPLFVITHNDRAEYVDDKAGSATMDQAVQTCPGCYGPLNEINILSEAEWMEVRWREALWVPPAIAGRVGSEVRHE